MKRFLCAVMLIVLVCSFAAAESIDLSGLSLSDLITLRGKVNRAIWASDGWQEVTVPQGVWVGGEDIPVGRWTVRCGYGWAELTYGDALEPNGRDIARTDARGYFYVRSEDTDIPAYATEEYLDVFDGMYITISMAPLIFSTYTGKPDLGFK